MREILFRGKRKNNGEWVYGSLVHRTEYYGGNCDDYFILQGGEFDYDIYDAFEVDPETVCQFTGLTDKNGVKIWENDVVFVTDDNGCSGQVDTGVGEIDFLEGLWYISGSVQNSLYDIDKCFQIEVIGNIFDNPELMEGGAE